MNIISFAWDNFKSSLAGRDNKLVMWTQGILAVMLLTLTMTSGAIQTYLTDNLKTLLGADMVIEHERALSPKEHDRLSSSVQTISETMLVPISLANGKQWQRIELKVVDDNYPVQGAVKLSDQLGGKAVSVTNSPKVGEIWIDGRIGSHLQLKVGDHINIGNNRLKVAGILQYEPDRLLEGHSIEMRAILNGKSLSKGFEFSGRHKYRYLITADADQRGSVHEWIQSSHLNITVIDRHKGQHPFAAYWKRIENFLGLTFVLLFFMAAISINLASKPKLDATRYRLSLYMSMGLTNRQGLIMAFVEWVIAFVITLLPALIIAYFLQGMIQQEISSSFVGMTGNIDPVAVIRTGLLLFLMFLSMQVPMFIQLSKTSMISLIRDQLKGKDGLLKLMWNGISLSLLAFIYTDNWMLTAMVIITMISVLALLMVLSMVFFKLGNKWGSKRTGLLPFVLFMMKERQFVKSSQIIGLGMSITLLLVSLGLMQDLKASMNSQVRTNNGNLVISDMTQRAVPQLQKWASNTDSSILSLHPFMHASVVAIEGKTLDEFSERPSEAKSRLERPIRLSWSEAVPINNRVTGGQWWGAADKNWRVISVEDEVMMDMGLSHGDTITFDISGKHEQFTIVSSHVFKSGGNSITFWFQVPAQARQYVQGTTHYMGGLEASENGWSQLGDLLQNNPSLRLVTLREITERLDASFALVSKATTGFSLIILILALIVIIASVSAFEADDKKRNGLLLSMGLVKADCLRMTVYEWLITALIAAMGAVAGTWMMGALIYAEQLSMTYHPNGALYFGTILLVTISVTLLGLYFCRSAMNVSIYQQINET